MKTNDCNRREVLVLPWIAGALLGLNGCANSIYLYETEKVSFTVQGKPADVNEPVAANFGLKQRVVAVVPRKGDGQDAMSAISTFNLTKKHKDNVGWLGNDEITIETVMLTGSAASTQTDVAGVMEALAGMPDTFNVALLGDTYGDIGAVATTGGSAVAARHLAALNLAATDTFLPVCDPLPDYRWDGSSEALTRADGAISITTIVRNAPALPRFRQATQYLAMLTESIGHLKAFAAAAANPSLQFTQDGRSAGPADRTQALADLQKSEAVRDKLKKLIAENQAVREARNFRASVIARR